MDVVAQANPLASLTPEVLRKKRDSPTMTVSTGCGSCAISRPRCRQRVAVRRNGTPSFEPDLEVDTELDGFGWIDVGWKIDTTGIGVSVVGGPGTADRDGHAGARASGSMRLQIVRRSLDRHERYPHLAGLGDGPERRRAADGADAREG
jgi:hypothetical protein